MCGSRQENAEAHIPLALRGAEAQQLFALDVEHARYRYRCFFHSEGERARWHNLLRGGNASFKTAHRLAARNSLLATQCKRDAKVGSSPRRLPISSRGLESV